MFRSILLVLAVASVAFAITPTLDAPVLSFAGSSEYCKTVTQEGDWSLIDQSADYTKDFVGETRLCRQKAFISSCRTRLGVVPCNDYNSMCVDINHDIEWDNAVFHPEYVNRVTKRPEVCVSQGAYLHPDAAVAVIALIIIGWLALLLAVVALGRFVGDNKPSGALSFVLYAMFVICSLLLFSFYYLNGLLCLTAMYVAYTLFATKRAELMAFGLVFLMLALYWVTFESALGYVQHNSRFSNNLPSAKKDMNLCEAYYRGYFYYLPERQNDFENPVLDGVSFCQRQWLAAELFFMILVELFLGFAVVCGAASFFAPTTVEQKEQPEQHAEGQEMESRV